VAPILVHNEIIQADDWQTWHEYTKLLLVEGTMLDTIHHTYQHNELQIKLMKITSHKLPRRHV
jgi:hypothetical protein